MALITCPECGYKISDKAKKCPRCGLPITNEILRLGGVNNSNRTPYIVATVTLVLLAIVAGIYLLANKVNTGETADVEDEQVEEANQSSSSATDIREPQSEEMAQTTTSPTAEESPQSVKATELVITEEKNVKDEDQIKSQDELKETGTAYGQNDNNHGAQDREVTRTQDEVAVRKEKPKQEQVFTAVEHMPEFPGGQAALLKFISSHLQYPQAAADNNVQGKVYVKFVVTSTGRVEKVQIARSVDKALDQEALRVCRMLPNFTPGRQDGQPVNVWYTLPITFKLNN